MYGKLSWRYTAVECFSQEAPALLSEALAHGTRLISHSARFDLSKRGSSLFAKYSRHRKENVPSLDALEEELQQLQEQVSSDDERSRGTVASVPLPSKTTLELSGFWDGHSVAKPSYNEKVDIYSWAMVYYEMLTLNQPFAKMSQREHYRNVCGRTLNGYEGGQRPGVYQYNLTPSMISLLQRAWDQCPSKRPNMESVGRNLQTILRELEEMIKAEQRKMALAITAGGDAILVTGQHKTTEKQQQQRYNVTQKQNSEKGSVFMRKNKKKHPPPTSAVVPLPDNTVSSPKTDKERDISWSSEIDLAALEYENWDDLNDEMDDEESELDDSDEESKLSGDEESTEKASNDGSSPLHLGNDNGPGSSDLNSVEVDPVGGTIANKHRSETKTLPSSRARSSSNQSGTLRRMRSKSAMPSNKKSRRFDSEYFERRTTNRLSRRTIRLSGRIMWLLHKRDPKVMLLFVAITFLILLGAGSAGYHWYQKKQNSVLGVPLDELAGLNRTGAMAKLQEKINIRCQRDVPPIEYPTLPLLFKGGALTPYDDDCIVQLQKDAEEQLALKLNWTDLEDDITLSSSPIQKNSTNQECGFLKMHSFDAPPPTKKQRKSKWQRKKPWKFFRDQE